MARRSRDGEVTALHLPTIDTSFRLAFPATGGASPVFPHEGVFLFDGTKASDFCPLFLPLCLITDELVGLAAQ